MDARALLNCMAYQLYQDIRFVTEQNPTQVVDEDGVKAYNGLLNRARQVFADAEPLQEMENWNARTIKYKDALLVTGQLFSIISAYSEGNVRMPSPAAPAPQPQQQAAPRPQQAPPQQQQQHRPAPAQQQPQRTPSHADLQRNARQNPGMNDSLDLEENESYDSELYGPGKPPVRNEDGTIPFSLE